MRDETMTLIMQGNIARMAARLRDDADRRAKAPGEFYFARYSPDELRQIADMLEWRVADR